ncbi:MAG: GntR family transcriptional regulator [Bacteroidota bacterium]
MNKTSYKSLRDKAYYCIKEGIITYKYQPGSPLPEEQLSLELGISRTPIREALKELQYNGLVRYIPSKGVFVSELSIKDIHEVFFLRQVLEVAALHITIQNYKESDLKPLKALFTSLLNRKLGEGDYESLFQSDINLHNFIIETAGNRRLIEFVSVLSDQIERIRHTSARMPGRMAVSVKEHYDILNAIEKRDHENAEKLLVKHLENVKNSALSMSNF